LRTVVENSQASINKLDLELFFNLIRDFDPRNILEIGTWLGYSAKVWNEAFDPKKIVTIENHFDTFEEINKHDDIIYFCGDSHDQKTLEIVKEEFGITKHNEPLIDFLFIDGDHSYEGVKKDWEMYSPLVREGGIVLFHDVVYTSDDPLSPVLVKQFWQEIRGEYDWAEIKSLGSTGIGIIFK